MYIPTGHPAQPATQFIFVKDGFDAVPVDPFCQLLEDATQVQPFPHGRSAFSDHWFNAAAPAPAVDPLAFPQALPFLCIFPVPVKVPLTKNLKPLGFNICHAGRSRSS